MVVVSARIELSNCSLIVTRMMLCNVHVDAAACLLDLQTASQDSDEPISAKRLIGFWEKEFEGLRLSLWCSDLHP